MAFTLSIYPWVYKAKFTDGLWSEEFSEKAHKSPVEEAALPPDEYNRLLASRNSFPELPLVNYTTQYGLGCFEGLKAYPQPDGSLKVFRPEENAKRMRRSMEGLQMPGIPENLFVSAVIAMVHKNRDLGFAPVYDASWENDNFASGHAIYIRPFSYSEPAIGLGLSHLPWVVMIGTPVGSYFRPGSTAARTTNKIRATPHGTGWIKCDANYVIPTLAKKEAEAEGYMEVVFLDPKENKYIEEGSSCNIFFCLKNKTLVTPVLGDTILPGITRASIIELARDKGIKVEERKISIEEAMNEGTECFVTGTAAGVSPLEALTHDGKTAQYNKGAKDSISYELQQTLKGIQYGKLKDKFGWMKTV